MAFLEIADIKTYYGNIQALKGVSLTVEEGECVTLIGANGAGKTTTLRAISGLTPPRAGSIRFAGQDIATAPPQEIVRLGISHSPEGRRCFARMSVRENLQMGASLDSLRYFDEDVEKVFQLFPRIKERLRQRGGTLSGGEQQMLSIGRAPRRDASCSTATTSPGCRPSRSCGSASRRRRRDGASSRA